MKSMNYLKVAEVATRAGLTERAIYLALKDGSLATRGGRNGISEGAVTAFIVNRQQTAVDRVGDLTRFAESARKRAQELGGKRGTHYPSDGDAVAIFGPAAVDAARIPDDARVCRWCWANLTASAHGGIQPGRDRRLYPAFVALLGPPCTEDAKRLMAAWRTELDYGKDAVTEPTQDTPPARTAAAKAKTFAKSGTKACGVPVGVRCECHTSDRPGGPQPARPDKGTALSAARRKTLTAAIKTAQDRGDRKHVQELRGLLAALGPQAVRTSKPTSGTPRSEPHGCGCQCPQHRSQP